MNKVLLVDDEQAIRLAVRMALRREGMDVTEASDGLEALELLKKEKFQLVILDVMMERVGGYEVLQKMRASGDHTPVMMLSGKSDEMDQVLGLGFGATNSVYPVTINKSYGPVYAGGIYGVALFGYMIFCTLITPRISAALVASTGGYTASFIYGIVLSCVAVASMYLIPKVDRKPLDAAEKQAESV